MVFGIIKLWNIDSFDLRCHLQKFFSCSVLFLVFLIGIQKLIINGLALSNVKKVKKVSQRLWIDGTWASSDDNRIFFCTILAEQRNTRKIQYLQNVGIAHLILDRNAEEIKFPDRILGLQGKQRNVLLSHNPVQVGPWGVNTLAPRILSPVEHVI